MSLFSVGCFIGALLSGGIHYYCDHVTLCHVMRSLQCCLILLVGRVLSLLGVWSSLLAELCKQLHIICGEEYDLISPYSSLPFSLSLLLLPLSLLPFSLSSFLALLFSRMVLVGRMVAGIGVG